MSCAQQQTITRPGTTTLTAYLEANPNQIGLVKIKGDVITESNAASGAALIVATSSES